MIGILAVIGILSSLVVGTLLNGWVLSILWRWFIVSAFSIPALTIAQAIGLALVVSYLTYHSVDCQPADGDASEKLVKSIMYTIIKPLIVLCIGWIIHNWV